MSFDTLLLFYIFGLVIEWVQSSWLLLDLQFMGASYQIRFIENSCSSNRLLSTIDGNAVFVHSQYSCILTLQVSTQFLCPTKLLSIVIIFEELILQWKRCNFMSYLFSVFTLFYSILKDMSNNVRKFRVTSCIIDPFLCCHILYLIIYLTQISERSL